MFGFINLKENLLIVPIAEFLIKKKSFATLTKTILIAEILMTMFLVVASVIICMILFIILKIVLLKNRLPNKLYVFNLGHSL